MEGKLEDGMEGKLEDGMEGNLRMLVSVSVVWFIYVFLTLEIL